MADQNLIGVLDALYRSEDDAGLRAWFDALSREDKVELLRQMAVDPSGEDFIAAGKKLK